MGSSTGSTGEVIANGLETFEILEKLSISKESTLYRVVCKSGRLRNRQLAIRKIPVSPVASSPVKPEIPPWTFLHQALHHPNIVSMLSVFSTAQETVHVLELCSAGDLCQVLHSRFRQTLTEPELRGVVRSLIDALCYLRKELVIHRDINPSNILLTSDYGIKLSGFENAVRLTSKHITTYPFSNTSQDYVAPYERTPLLSFFFSSFSDSEILSGQPHGFPADIWSLGCVMVYCLTGFAPAKSAQSEYQLSGDHSSDVTALVSSLLQVVPENRMYLPAMLSHSFLANKPTISLHLGSTFKSAKAMIHGSPNQLPNFRSPGKISSFKFNRPEHITMRHASDNSLHSARNKLGFDPEAVGRNPRDLLYNELTSGKTKTSSQPTRRIVSDPARHRPAEDLRMRSPNGGSDVNIKPFTANFNRTAPASKMRKDIDISSIALGAASPQAQSKLTDVTHIAQDDTTPAEYSKGKRDPSNIESHDDQMVIIIYKLLFIRIVGDITDINVVPRKTASKLPIGTSRPRPFSTAGLACQTHKTAHGQLTVLRSHSVLVDFRESQRRKGMKGNEVLIIGPDGHKIAVYSAPHLSSPCCLVEPTREFSIQTLPHMYWKQYNDACRLVGQIKRRTPRLVLYSAGVRCTLMANTPQGDIEVLLSDHDASSSVTRSLHSQSARICLSRQEKSVHFARYSPDIQGEGWIKKVAPLTAGPPYVSNLHLKDLKQEEKVALEHLVHFMYLSETLEGLTSKTPMDSTGADLPVRQYDELPPFTEADVSQPDRTSSAMPRGISFLSIAPRPPKISATATLREKKNSSNAGELIFSERMAPGQETGVERGFSNVNSMWRDPNQTAKKDKGQDVQSRFIPSTGWCVRYPSRVSQGGRYKILFLDGVTLNIDVDEDWMEFKDTSGETVIHSIGDCGAERRIGDRMKIFEEFVSLFDHSQ